MNGGTPVTTSCLTTQTIVYDADKRTLKISNLYADSDNDEVLHRNHKFSFTIQGWTWVTKATPADRGTDTVDFTIKSKWTETLDDGTNPIYDIDTFGTFAFGPLIEAYGDFTAVPASLVPSA